jgi:hypothetical protein
MVGLVGGRGAMVAGSLRGAALRWRAC